MKDTEIITKAITSLENGAYDHETADALRDVLKRHTAMRTKVQKYEEFLHAINYAMTAGNHERVRKLVDNAFRWSYAHRAGNGEYTDEEQDAMVARAMEKLTEE